MYSYPSLKCDFLDIITIIIHLYLMLVSQDFCSALMQKLERNCAFSLVCVCVVYRAAFQFGDIVIVGWLVFKLLQSKRQRQQSDVVLYTSNLCRRPS